MDIRRQCVVCAWRGDCAKKYTLRETALHCPDFCEDQTLPKEAISRKPSDSHRRVEDVFQKKTSG